MYVCLLWVLCVVRYRSLRRADHSSRGVLLSVVCLSVIVKPRKMRRPRPPRGCRAIGKKNGWLIALYTKLFLTLIHLRYVFLGLAALWFCSMYVLLFL
jgi:hypothetical protein